MEEDYGGGVCQVSSTLYNSVLYAGLEIVNVKNHTIPSSYVPKGRDATVADSGIDFLFKNNLKHPVYIKITFQEIKLFAIYMEVQKINKI